MEFIAVIIVIALMFGICFCVDKLFQKLFRNKAQHKAGTSVRLSKRYGAIGLLIFALGVAGSFAGFGSQWVLFGGGCFLILVGIALVVYYMTFSIFYDDDAFILTTFGKKSKTYAFSDIRTQQLFVSGNSVVVELALADGRTFQVQSTMEGMYPFMDHAFSAWLRQTGRAEAECADFHDPQKSWWFPQEEA